MRILVLAPGFPVWSGPFTPAVIDTLSMMAEDHALEIHGIGGSIEAKGRTVFRGLEIVAYGAGRIGPQLASFLAELVRRGRSADFDVIWCLWANRTSTAALAAQRLLRRPLVVSMMGSELARLPEVAYGTLRTASGRSTMRAILAAADHVTVPSEPMEGLLRAFHPAALRKTSRAPLGADAEAIPARSVPPWRAPEPLRVLSISDLSPVKRVHLAVDAVDHLLHSGQPATLDVFGSDYGGAAAAFETRAAGVGGHSVTIRRERSGQRVRARSVPDPHAATWATAPGADPGWASGHDDEQLVRYRGFVPARELWAHLDDYDVLLHASAHESEGLALVEAAIAGLPIASVDVGVVRELAELGANVELAAEATPEALALAARHAAARPPGLTAPIRARFDLPVCVARFVSILQAVADGHPDHRWGR